MENVFNTPLDQINLKYIIDCVINDDKLDSINKANLLREKKLQLYYNLKYHNLTKEMKKEVKNGIKHIEDWINLRKLNKNNHD